MRLTRRSVVAAVPFAAACAGAAQAAALYVAPDGQGGGASWEDAANLNDLDELIGRLGPGGEILLAADAGAYELHSEIQLASGGRRRQFVWVRGVHRGTGEPQAALLRGASGDAHEGFRLRRGADYLHFSHLRFERFGNGCFRVAERVTGLMIEDCTFQQVYRFLENTASDDGGGANLRQFVVRRCHGDHVARGFLRIRYASRGGVIEDCAAQGVPRQGEDFPTGCALEDKAGDIVYRRCVMENFQQLHAGDYWNGDGFSDESENFGVRYEHCQARGSTDGGFDCKSRDVVLQHCVAEDNKRNFRFWSERATLAGCISRAPRMRGMEEESADACHVWVGGEAGPAVSINDFTVEDRDAASIFSIEAEDARIELQGLHVHSPRINWGDGRVRHVVGAVTTITPQ